MSYLKQPRAKRALLLSLASATLFVGFPGLDLRVSGWFHRNDRFPFADSGWVGFLHESVGFSICVALAAVLGVYTFNTCRRSNAFGIDARVVGYLLSVLVLGAGLTVNVVLKNGFGRARPRNVEEFGGRQRFTPAFVVANECAGNCSFSSGDTAGAFFTLALALALRHRYAMLAAVVFGSLVSLSRIAAGAHFLSDTIVSFLVMWITADGLYYYMLLPREEEAAARTAAARASVELEEKRVYEFEVAASHNPAGAGENGRGAG